MFTQALRKIRMSVLTQTARASTSQQKLFEVHLMGGPMDRFGAVPLSFTTPHPNELAADLMQDRDPGRWSVEIRPHSPRPPRVS